MPDPRPIPAWAASLTPEDLLDVAAALWVEREGYPDTDWDLDFITAAERAIQATLPEWWADEDAEASRVGPLPRSRRPIRRSTRAAVFERDGRSCISCGSTDDLTIDHVQPWSLGGTDDEDNLQVLCRHCNSSKGNRV